jgi:hypothetical protein
LASRLNSSRPECVVSDPRTDAAALDRRAYEEAITNPPNPSLRQTAIGRHLGRQVELLKSGKERAIL